MGYSFILRDQNKPSLGYQISKIKHLNKLANKNGGKVAIIFKWQYFVYMKMDNPHEIVLKNNTLRPSTLTLTITEATASPSSSILLKIANDKI